MFSSLDICLLSNHCVIYGSQYITSSCLRVSGVVKALPDQLSLCPPPPRPTLSPTPRLLPQCGSSVSKEPISQYDSPRYSSSPCWYNPHAYEDARPPSKRELPMMSPGLRAMPPSPYPAPLQRGPSHTGACEPEEYGYPRGGVLCQLLDQSSEDCFTSL